MSNVLIGIIGVILFIGLALAGALILGDDFKSASSSSQAAAVVSQLQQTQSAIEMWRLKTGQRQIMTQDTSFLVPRFLKTRAVNASSYRNAGVPYWNEVFLNNDIDANQDNEAKGYVARWAMVIMGISTDTKARDTCLAIEEGQGRTTIATTNVPTNPVGCSLANGQYYTAYAYFGA
jgi:hypothetical protein